MTTSAINGQLGDLAEEPVQSTCSLLLTATETIREELVQAQLHVTQATDLIHQLFVDLPKTLQTPSTTDIPSTILTSTRAGTPQQIEEVDDSPPPCAPHPVLPDDDQRPSPTPAPSPADSPDTEWTEDQINTLIDEKLNEVKRPSWKTVAKKVGMPEDQCKAKWNELKPDNVNKEKSSPPTQTTTPASSKRRRTE